MLRSDAQLKDFIINSKLVSRADAEKAEEASLSKGVGIGAILKESGKISDADLKRIESVVFGVPYVSLLGAEIEKEALFLVPESVARRNNVIAFGKNDRGVEVAVLDLDSLDSVSFLRTRLGMKVLPRLTDEESMKNALSGYQGELKEKFDEIVKKEAGMLDGSLSRATSEKELKKISVSVPATRVVDTLIRRAIVEKASDMHLEPTGHGVSVRYRINGNLYDSVTLPTSSLPGILARIKFLATLKLSERKMPQDGRFKIDTGEERVTIRVSTLPTAFGEKAVLKFISESADGFTLEGLGIHGEALETLTSAIKSKEGFLVVTGSRESGKTTLLYTILDILKDPKTSVVTVENPIEYRMSGVTQVEASSELTMEGALRSVLNQDPDVIMLGDIPNDETASLAVTAVNSGKMVIASLEADSGSEAISELLKTDIYPTSLAETLKVVVDSRLVRVLGPSKVKHKISDEEFAKLEKHADMEKVLSALKNERIVPSSTMWEDIDFYKSKGDEGHGGWIGIYEVMRMTPAIRSLVRGGSGGAKVESQARKEGGLSIVEDGIFKAAQGIISIDEVLRVVRG